MPTSTAIVVSHHGTMDGSASAISQAVTTAEPSVRVMAMGRLRSARIAASAASATSVAMARSTRMPAPTCQT